MASGYACQRCSQLPPPPPIFALGPPPNLLSIEARCSSRRLSLPSVDSRTGHTSSSSSSLSAAIVLGILITLFISLSTIVLLKKRRQQRHRTKCPTSRMNTSSAVRYSNHHHHRNWPTCMPLLSDSCSSDQTASTPPNEYPSSHVGGNAAVEPLLARDAQHEYEQIRCDDSSSSSMHYYCLVYCRQCANYHPSSSSSSTSSTSCPRTNLHRACYLPLSTNPACQHACSCYHRTYYQRHDNRFFELQPMLMTRMDNNSDESSHPLKFIEESPPT